MCLPYFSPPMFSHFLPPMFLSQGERRHPGGGQQVAEQRARREARARVRVRAHRRVQEAQPRGLRQW